MSLEATNLLAYKEEGNGPCIVLLHGFLSSKKIWKAYSHKLSSKFKIIRVDLPGHGKSAVFAESHSMELMAKLVHQLLSAKGIKQYMLVGHSMGGYVALAMAELYPNEVLALSLINSSAFADDPEKRKDRDRAIKAAEGHKVKFITSLIPNWFYERTGNKASKRILKMVELAANCSKEGIQAALRGMRDRPDRLDVWKNSNFPRQLIAGQEDFVIPFEKSQALGQISGVRFDSLPACGHMAFMECKDACFKALQSFALENVL